MTSGGRDDGRLDPLPADVRDLLAAGGAHVVGPDPAVRGRLRARLLALAPTGGPISDASPPPAVAAGTGAGGLLAKPILLALATYALGVGSGVAWQARRRSPAPMAAAVPAGRSTPPPATAPVLPAAAVTPASPPAAAVACPAPPARARHAADPEDGLGRERALLDQARASLVGGDAAAALAALDRHRRAFADGRLAEEREVLRIQALLAAARPGDARAEAARFLRRHPSSLFRPAVEQAVDLPAADD